MKRIRIILLGFGNVGKAFAHRIIEFANNPLARKIDFDSAISVAGILTTRGFYSIDQSSWRSELYRVANSYPSKDIVDRFISRSIDDVVKNIKPELAVVAIPPSYGDGEPNLSIYNTLIGNGVSIITADKTGLALRYWNLIDEAIRKRVFIGYRATVMAGTPAIDVVRGLAGKEVLRIESILNATTNYIISLIESGKTFVQALNQARDEGLTEPDPRIDYEGYDSAAKLSILLNILGYKATIRDIERISLAELGEKYIRGAIERNKVVRYIAWAEMRNGYLTRAKVEPVELSRTDPLASVVGNYNGLVIKSTHGDITLLGPAGPASNTAEAMLSDLLEFLINRNLYSL